MFVCCETTVYPDLRRHANTTEAKLCWTWSLQQSLSVLQTLTSFWRRLSCSWIDSWEVVLRLKMYNNGTTLTSVMVLWFVVKKKKRKKVAFEVLRFFFCVQHNQRQWAPLCGCGGGGRELNLRTYRGTAEELPGWTGGQRGLVRNTSTWGYSGP